MNAPRWLSVPYRLAAVCAAAGLGSVGWALMAGPEAPAGALLLAAAAAPLTVLFAVWGRLGTRFPGPAVAGGAVIGPLVALASHTLVAAFAAAFLLGFADSGRRLLDSLRLDPRLTTVLASPWVLLLLVELVVVAPLTEEAGKALGARLFRPSSRKEAFVSGVAAGAGFAMVENLLYAGAAAALGGPWPAVVLARALGAAVHPLATGIVVLGWFDWKANRDPLALARRLLAGAGVHALWNGSLVALFVVQVAYRRAEIWSGLGPVSVSYAALIGIVLAGVLWRLAERLADELPSREGFARGDARAMARWTILAASFLVPAVLLVLAFPGFYVG